MSVLPGLRVSRDAADASLLKLIDAGKTFIPEGTFHSLQSGTVKRAVNRWIKEARRSLSVIFDGDQFLREFDLAGPAPTFRPTPRGKDFLQRLMGKFTAEVVRLITAKVTCLESIRGRLALIPDPRSPRETPGRGERPVATSAETATGEEWHPVVFISYSHDKNPADHVDRVHRLANELVKSGVDVRIDLYHPFPPEGWPKWMLRQIKECDFVLCICTSTYRERFENQTPDEEGKGARFEGHVITNQIYQDACQNEKFVPVLFGDASVVFHK